MNTRYTVGQADLITIADAACELDGMRQFYVDQPSEQERIARMVSSLHNLVERAAEHDTKLIYGPAEGMTPLENAEPAALNEFMADG